MTIANLDLQFHLQGPKSCRLCVHSSTYKKQWGASERLACKKIIHRPSCVFARHESGECGPEASYWKAVG